MDLVNEQLSPESSVKIEITGGNIVLTGGLDTAGVKVSVLATASVDYFLDELAKKIPGTIDDAIFAVMKSALKAL